MVKTGVVSPLVENGKECEMKTSELQGAALDWAVAKCEGDEYVAKSGVDGIGNEYEATNYSTDWAQGGPIIEREAITVERWNEEYEFRADMAGEYEQFGDTYLEAAMRCYVASKLGDEVEIPEELK